MSELPARSDTEAETVIEPSSRPDISAPMAVQALLLTVAVVFTTGFVPSSNVIVTVCPVSTSVEVPVITSAPSSLALTKSSVEIGVVIAIVAVGS